MTTQLHFPHMPTQLEHQLALPMRYQAGRNAKETGLIRREVTMRYVGRFELISPTFIMWLYGVSRYLALHHLNKLKDEGLLTLITTHRSVDNRIYTLTYAGARYAEELLQQQLYFRSSAQPDSQVNHNTIMHDLILQFVMAAGIHQTTADGSHAPLWSGFVSEKEFRRLFPSNATRNVDGLVMEADKTLCAVEMEHSFKNKAARKVILLKYLDGIKSGNYSKVFLFSQSQAILDDIKRLHDALLDELPTTYNRKTKQNFITEQDKQLLQKAIIYRNKYCDAISSLFYI